MDIDLCMYTLHLLLLGRLLTMTLTHPIFLNFHRSLRTFPVLTARKSEPRDNDMSRFLLTHPSPPDIIAHTHIQATPCFSAASPTSVPVCWLVNDMQLLGLLILIVVRHCSACSCSLTC